MRILSNRFFGNKVIDAVTYDQLKACVSDSKAVEKILSDCYPQSYQLYQSFDKLLLPIYTQFFLNQLKFTIEKNYIFEKATCLLELSIHIFNQAWDKRATKEKTFEQFRQIIVRHSLYRPPHCVYVFSLDNLKEISLHFINTFFRYYQAYFFTFTPWVDIVVTTYQKHQMKIDVKDMELEKLREEANQYQDQVDPELMEQLMHGNSVHQIPEKKRRELEEQERQRIKLERIDRILKARLEQLQIEFDEKVKSQDADFLKLAEDLKNPKKK